MIRILDGNIDNLEWIDELIEELNYQIERQTLKNGQLIGLTFEEVDEIISGLNQISGELSGWRYEAP